jgi:hypothetical protein
MIASRMALVRTWSYCGGLDPVGTFRNVPGILFDCEVWVVVEKTTGLKILS